MTEEGSQHSLKSTGKADNLGSESSTVIMTFVPATTQTPYLETSLVVQW